MNFYNNFLSLCNSVGKTPSRVVLEIGLKKSAVTRWKTGGMPTDATLCKIAEYFNVSVDVLLANKAETPAPIGNEPLSLDYLRTLSSEELLQLMKDATQALSEK